MRLRRVQVGKNRVDPGDRFFGFCYLAFYLGVQHGEMILQIRGAAGAPLTEHPVSGGLRAPPREVRSLSLLPPFVRLFSLTAGTSERNIFKLLDKVCTELDIRHSVEGLVVPERRTDHAESIAGVSRWQT